MELLAIMFWIGVLGIAIVISLNARKWADRLFPLEPPPAQTVQHCRSMVDAVRKVQEWDMDYLERRRK